jgi:hypothetical protein
MGRWMDKAKEMQASQKAEGEGVPRSEPIGLTNGAEMSSGHTTEKTPKLTPGQHVLIIDNFNRVRTGVIQFAGWIDEPLTAKGWWYCIIDVYGLLSETHESRLTDSGLVKKVSR